MCNLLAVNHVLWETHQCLKDNSNNDNFKKQKNPKKTPQKPYYTRNLTWWIVILCNALISNSSLNFKTQILSSFILFCTIYLFTTDLIVYYFWFLFVWFVGFFHFVCLGFFRYAFFTISNCVELKVVKGMLKHVCTNLLKNKCK